MAERTEGSWEAKPHQFGGDSWWVETPDGGILVSMQTPSCNEAYARFIATGPEMVAKLIELHAFIVDQYGESEEAEELAKLIAKAEGRQL